MSVEAKRPYKLRPILARGCSSLSMVDMAVTGLFREHQRSFAVGGELSRQAWWDRWKNDVKKS